MRPRDEPGVIAVGAELVRRIEALQNSVAERTDPMAGAESVFLGQIHSGEIFNQFPQECWLEGTRRWLPGTAREQVEAELRGLFDGLAAETGTTIEAEFHLMRDAFRLDPETPAPTTFLQAYEAVTGGTLPAGPKPFCDDGNSFWALAGVPAITHGPRAGGAHTLDEWVSVDDLVRVALVYAVTAALYCPAPVRVRTLEAP
jgi:acetylornithine deacetylase/succinyl-diaminopimelate desuccinylase-like protein